MSRRCVRRGSALSDPGRERSPQTVTHRQRTEALLVAGTGQRHLCKNLTSVSVDATCQVPLAVGHPTSETLKRKTRSAPKKPKSTQPWGQDSVPSAPCPGEACSGCPQLPTPQGRPGHHTGQWEPEGGGAGKSPRPPVNQSSFRAAVRCRTRVGKEQSPHQLLGGAGDSDRDSALGVGGGRPSSMSPPARCVICSFTRPRSSFYGKLATWNRPQEDTDVEPTPS